MNIDNKISIHHIGGRAGSRSFPVLPAFEQDIISVLYDADTDCLEQITERNAHLQSELHVLPYCIGDRSENADCHLHYDPYTSSLAQSNPEYSHFYSSSDRCDYIIGEATKVMETRLINTHSLDDVLIQDHPEIPPPDLLSIDTEGTAFTILKNAGMTLEHHVLALVVEAQFHEMSLDQRLFGDVTSFLAARGFHFARFLSLHDHSPSREAIGFRSGGFTMATDALYVRRLTRIKDIPEITAATRYTMLSKLAFISLVFNQLEYAFQCLHERKTIPQESAEPQNHTLPRYRTFLDTLETIHQQAPKRYPTTFACKYSYQQSKTRFDPTPQAGNTSHRARAKDTLKQYAPRLYVIIRSVYWFVTRTMRRGMTAGSRILNWVRYRLSALGNSDIERLFLKHGLLEQAAKIKQRRLEEAPWVESDHQNT